MQYNYYEYQPRKHFKSRVGIVFIPCRSNSQDSNTVFCLFCLVYQQPFPVLAVKNISNLHSIFSTKTRLQLFNFKHYRWIEQHLQNKNDAHVCQCILYIIYNFSSVYCICLNMFLYSLDNIYHVLYGIKAVCAIFRNIIGFNVLNIFTVTS